MSTVNHGRLKRIHVEFRGDKAVEMDTLEMMLRMSEVSRTRMDCDTKLVRLALKALDRAIADYCGRTGQRYPTYSVLVKYLDEREAPAPADPVRVVNMQ